MMSFLGASAMAFVLGIIGLYYSFKLARLYKGGAFERPWLYILYAVALVSLCIILLFFDTLFNLGIAIVVYWIGVAGAFLVILGIREQAILWERGFRKED